MSTLTIRCIRSSMRPSSREGRVRLASVRIAWLCLSQFTDRPPLLRLLDCLGLGLGLGLGLPNLACPGLGS